MELFKFNSDKLTYQKTNILLKYKLIIFLLLLSTFLLSFAVFEVTEHSKKLKQVIVQKDDVIAGKINKIIDINEPMRDETYVEDLYKYIGFKLTPQQYERFSYLALKYRKDIEAAKIPATLVWWTAYKESRFDPEQKNLSSTAKGMFQFLDGTWNEVCKMKGYSRDGRFSEEKQVKVMLAYLNYLYGKYGSWGKSMEEYHGGEYQYPITFLFK
jgi:hypothetical protein